MRLAALFATVLLLGACGPTAPLSPVPLQAPQPTVARDPVAAATAAEKARNFVAVITAVEPVAERLCRERRVADNCDFQILVDGRPGMPPNAYQTVDRRGRPIIGFTLALIIGAENMDELAFVLGHEAGHHIAGHIPKQREEVMSAALTAAVQARAAGRSDAEVRAAQGQAAQLAIRSFSQAFELEADVLGAEIALMAGFDPVRGARFFDRLPQPGNRFLTTHPPNAQRQAVVAETVRRLGGTR